MNGKQPLSLQRWPGDSKGRFEGEKEDNGRSSDRSMRGAIPDKRGKKEEVSNQATNLLVIQHLELSTVRIN